MAAVVYEGVGGGGDLFKGIKFCILQRVPSRLHWIDLVKANGGENVPLEKQADIVIADHARKDTPAGSISWRYIEQSVKKGILEELDFHPAGPSQHTAREVASGGPTRSWRTPFTTEDDRILRDWVTRGERAGLHAKGNDLFKQLEERNNRHTFQSWRDRWIKTVQFHPRPNASEDLPSSDGPSPVVQPHRGRPKRSSTSSDLRRHPPQSQSGETSTSRPAAAKAPPTSAVSNNGSKEQTPQSPVPWAAKSAGGIHFSSEEIALLVDTYDDIMNIDEDMAFDAWSAWSIMYPNHTPQEWRNYFTKQLVPMVKKKRKVDLQTKITPTKPGRLSNPEESPQQSKSSLAKSDTENFDSHSVDEDRPAADNQLVDPSLEDEAIFEQCLLEVAKQFDDLIEVIFTPIICGQPISLFELWQLVKTGYGGSERVTGRRLWPSVARRLGFKPSLQADAAEDLKHCYEEVLSDYEAIRENFYGMTESQEQELIEMQLFPAGSQKGDSEEEIAEELQVDEEEDIDDDLDAPVSSPTLPKSNKRNMVFQISRGLSSVAGSDNKRQRVDKGKGKEREIPSTPDHIINGIQMPQKGLRPSPLKHPLFVDDEDRDDEFVIPPFKQPNFTSLEPSRRMLEPETQDFRFGSQVDENDDDLTDEPMPLASSPPQKIERMRKEAHIESSTQFQSRIDAENELSAFVDRYISLGYTDTNVLRALESTTLSTENASLVMEELQQGKEIPDDIPGVWTSEDDAVCEDVASLDSERIVTKHGTERVESRKSFLRDRREVANLPDESL